MYTDSNGMSLLEQISMMENIKEEMSQLQARINYLQPRAEAYGVVIQVLSLSGGRIMGAEERPADRILRTIENRLDELKKKREENKAIAQKAAQTGKDRTGLERADMQLMSDKERMLCALLDNLQLPHRSQMEIVGLVRATKKQMAAELDAVRNITGGGIAGAGSQDNGGLTSDRPAINTDYRD